MTIDEDIKCPHCFANDVVQADDLSPGEDRRELEACSKCKRPFVVRWRTPWPVVSVHTIDGLNDPEPDA